MAAPPAALPDQLPQDLLDAIARHGGVRQFPAQSILINEGDTTDSL
jgi:CRP/FNR family cyclic AMP-dependent transcriptional regulator